MPRQSKSLWELHNIAFQVTRRRTRHLRITVHPPEGEVRVSVPHFVSNAEVQAFIDERLSWVREQQAHFQAQPRAPEALLNDGDEVSIWGQPVALKLQMKTSVHDKAQFNGRSLLLQVGDLDDLLAKRKLLDKFYRKTLREEIPHCLALWEPRLNVKAAAWGIKKMRTRWGTCNINDARIWLNLDLVRYTKNCLRYVVLHELAHLLEANHSPRFWSIIDKHFPEWELAEQQLKATQLNLA